MAGPSRLAMGWPSPAMAGHGQAWDAILILYCYGIPNRCYSNSRFQVYCKVKMHEQKHSLRNVRHKKAKFSKTFVWPNSPGTMPLPALCRPPGPVSDQQPDPVLGQRPGLATTLRAHTISTAISTSRISISQILLASLGHFGSNLDSFV